MELYHYNHNHDAKTGRFTRSSGNNSSERIKPIDDRILKKGTILNSISYYGNSNEYLDKANSKGLMYTYNPDDKWDSKVYKGPFAYYKSMRLGYIAVREHSFKTIKDLNMPTRQERLEEFKKLYNDKKYRSKVQKELREVQKLLVNAGYVPVQKNTLTVNVKSLSSDDDYESAYEIFNHAMEAQHRYKSTTEYVKRMSSKYDAMVDDNNQTVYNNAHDPVIVFRAKQALEAVGDSKMITFNEIQDSITEVRNELEKEGKAVRI